MTGKTITYDERGDAIKTPGWFSWRHRTREAHDAARERYLSMHGPAARRARAAIRSEQLKP